MTKKYGVGIIGCGDISSNYIKHAKEVYYDYFEIIAVGDIVLEKAKNIAEKFEIEKYGLPDVVYEDPKVDIIINLTVPMAHEEVTIKALESGKHVYTEKPLATSREGMKRIIETAARLGKRVGCAPDSFMSAPAQTAKKALDEDWIGEPIGVNAICAMRGNEYWRPDADFFYHKGAGPMMDMAPYYMNVLISMLGGVDSVSTMSKITWPERTIKVQPRRGEKIQVEVPTYVSSALRFKNGVIATFVNSFDIWSTKQPFIEIYGEKGTLILPDPNHYKGDVLVRRFRDSEWRVLPQFVEYEKYGRGIGIVDMIRSIEAGVPHKASAEMAYHATDVIIAMDEAGESGNTVKLTSDANRLEGLWTTPETILWK
ncbi:MAG: Gfo/Idh/MocA family oxidoreductase [Clostridia bacterium]|nr:Gfo/Idh/MocA family oxidoreductase [Clostridia bacterium]